MSSTTPPTSAAQFWEDLYSGPDKKWSGKVNRVLADIAGTLTPGTALDLGCGEGGDVIWLASCGWTVTGIDISPTAIARAEVAAKEAGIDPSRARFVAADLNHLPDERFDLVTASFLHAPVGVELPRTEILRQAAGRVAPGGHLLITGHAGFPPWADVPDGHDHHFNSPQEEVDQLDLDPSFWEVLAAETRQRQATSPTGEPAELEDSIVLIRRRQ